MLDTIATALLYALLAAAMTGHVAVLLAVKARAEGLRRQQAGRADAPPPAAAVLPDAAWSITPAQPR